MGDAASNIDDTNNIVDLGDIVRKFRPDVQYYECIYRDVHQNAELSCMEERTAGVVAKELERLGYKVEQQIGGHGLVGILRNGDGSTVMLRSELDALPIKEETGLPYACSRTMIDQYGCLRPVMHACGHDLHLSCLLGAAALMIAARSYWQGILLVLFQPNEEHTGGAQAMVDDGLYNRVPVPDFVLGQHSDPIRVGRINLRPGPVLVAADTFHIKIFGNRSKTLNPQQSLNPVSLAAWIVVRLESIVSSEISPFDFAVVTCEEIHAGEKGLDYVGHAELTLDVKSYTSQVRKQLHSAIRRVVTKECTVAGTDREPEITVSQRAPMTSNDSRLVEALRKTFQPYFKGDVGEGLPRKPCEDFSLLATSVNKPYVFWFFGTVAAEKWDKAERENKLAEAIAQNHSPYYAPSLHPTMTVGIDALALGALTFLR